MAVQGVRQGKAHMKYNMFEDDIGIVAKGCSLFGRFSMMVDGPCMLFSSQAVDGYCVVLVL